MEERRRRKKEDMEKEMRIESVGEGSGSEEREGINLIRVICSRFKSALH